MLDEVTFVVVELDLNGVKGDLRVNTEATTTNFCRYSYRLVI
jgi:hypothetical protein